MCMLWLRRFSCILCCRNFSAFTRCISASSSTVIPVAAVSAVRVDSSGMLAEPFVACALPLFFNFRRSDSFMAASFFCFSISISFSTSAILNLFVASLARSRILAASEMLCAAVADEVVAAFDVEVTVAEELEVVVLLLTSPAGSIPTLLLCIPRLCMIPVTMLTLALRALTTAPLSVTGTIFLLLLEPGRGPLVGVGALLVPSSLSKPVKPT
mmetsp:Transcript_24924/g.42944  ORF Transcript_24924/g.42944 Transcript_24924/m.42944 type:complete len:213 (-) Transcript_24924:311-949(-)